MILEYQTLETTDMVFNKKWFTALPIWTAQLHITKTKITLTI